MEKRRKIEKTGKKENTEEKQGINVEIAPLWRVYLIKTKLDTYYCGVTNDIKRRFKEHQSNSKQCAKYLRGKQPLLLIWNTELLHKDEAMRHEYAIKKLPRVKKELLINHNIIEKEALEKFLKVSL